MVRLRKRKDKKKENINDKLIEETKKKRKLHKDSNNSYSFKEMIVIMIASIIIGFFSCVVILKVFTSEIDYLLLSKDLTKFINSYKTIVDNYNGKIDEDELIDSAIDGMVSSVGDVYTNYGDSEYTQNFNETVTGEYEGIGCTIKMENESIIVAEVFDGGPSKKAGLKSGDIILKVDNESYTTTDEISNYIKNANKKKVTLLISRDGKEKEISIKRDIVTLPTVTTKTFVSNDKKIGYIDISVFTDSTDKQFNKKLKKLEEDAIDGLIIDVRGNAGGYLSSVTNICNLFLEKGKIIYQLEKDGKVVKIKKDNTKEKRTYPITVLIDGGSASASEILASAIKESYKGKVVGVNSYGKGTVQQTKELEDGTMIKYTVENWLTPKGKWINEVGVTPTKEEALSEEYYNNPSDETDNQLQTAVNTLFD